MKSSSAYFYNRFSSLYPFVGFLLKPQKHTLYRKVNALTPGRLLEVGVGNGKDLRSYKNHQITGIDTSLKMLEIAEEYTESELLYMNGEALTFDDQEFDYIVLSHVIAVADNPEQLLAESFRVLRPGGHLFILNHFTPGNFLKYLDRSMSHLARKFHFRSVFHQEHLITLEKFELIEEIKFWPFSYFKLLIYQKQ